MQRVFILYLYMGQIQNKNTNKYYITFATSTQTACSLSPSSQVAPSDGETGVIHHKTHILVLLRFIAVVMCLCKFYTYNFDQPVEPACEFIFTNEQFVPSCVAASPVNPRLTLTSGSLLVPKWATIRSTAVFTAFTRADETNRAFISVLLWQQSHGSHLCAISQNPCRKVRCQYNNESELQICTVRFATAVKLSSRDLTHISLKTRQTFKDMSHKTLTKSAIQLLLSKKLFSFTLKVKQIFVSWFICEIDFYESKVKGLNQSAQHSCRCSLQLCKPALSGRRMISSLTAVASDNSVRSTSFRVIWFCLRCSITAQRAFTAHRLSVKKKWRCHPAFTY